MFTDDKIRINILESEWRAAPKEQQERIKKALIETYKIDIQQLISLDEEE